MRLTRRTGLGLLAAGLIRPARSATVWRMITEYPASAIPGEGVAFFAESATRLSSGLLTVQPGFDGMRSAAMIKAVSDHAVEVADAFTGALGADAPIFQLSALPFLTASTADTARLLSAARPSYQSALAARGAWLLYATPWPASGIWSRHPLPDAAALRDLRIRTYDPASTATFRAAGAAPVQISFTDAMPRLKSGEIDAMLSSGDGGAGARLWDILPHFTVLDYASPLSLAFCDAEARLALLPAARDAIDQAAADTEARQFHAMAARAAENEARMRASGMTIARSPALRAALVEAAAPIIADWSIKAGPDGRSILAAYR